MKNKCIILFVILLCLSKFSFGQGACVLSSHYLNFTRISEKTWYAVTFTFKDENQNIFYPDRYYLDIYKAEITLPTYYIDYFKTGGYDLGSLAPLVKKTITGNNVTVTYVYYYVRADIYYVYNKWAPLNLNVADNKILKVVIPYSNSSNATISSGENKRILANNRITLTNGFHAKSGSDVEIRIIECGKNAIADVPLSIELDANLVSGGENELLKQMEKDDFYDISIFPNPSTAGIFFIKVPELSKHAKIEIFNSTGEFVQQHPVTSSGQEININNLPDGIYYVKIYNGNECTNRKIVKQ